RKRHKITLASQKEMTTVTKSNQTDDRETARIWTGFIYLALHDGMQTDFRGTDLDLACLINEANIFRVIAKAACGTAGLSFDDLYADVSKRHEQQLTKTARRFIEKNRRQVTELRHKKGYPKQLEGAKMAYNNLTLIGGCMFAIAISLVL